VGIESAPQALPHVFQPISVGPFTLRNRLVCTGHNPHYDSGGLIGDQQIAFHTRKAKGGIAMSVTGGTSVHPSGGVLPFSPLVNFDDSVLPGYRRLAAAMHAEGARMLVQLGHGATASTSSHSGEAIWAPSVTFGDFARELPHVMTRAEIEEVLEAFHQAARRVRASGLDGVEINAFAGGLVQQFLSPATNQRTDDYGGSFENRVRFLAEMMQTCRDALGPDSILSLKLAGDELDDIGLRLEDMQKVVAALDPLDVIDLYVVASGNNLRRLPRVDHWPPTPAPHGLRANLAAGIHRVTQKPVAALCRIVDPRMAEELIANGVCDLVAIVRATIADPDFVNKAAEGKFDDIRPCVGANVCVDRIIDGGQMRCIHNAIIGREGQWGHAAPAALPRKVLVIGGGPAGLEAARLSAARGHHVTLIERERELGGSARTAALAPGRQELRGIAAWLTRQLEKLGVDVRRGVEAGVDDVLREKPDIVILATGAVDLAPQVRTLNPAIPIVTPDQVLSGAVMPGRHVLVFDRIGYNLGCAVAELVADSGGAAEVVSPHFHPAIDFGLTNTVSLYRRLFTKGVVLTPHHELDRVEGKEITLVNCYSKTPRTVRDIDMLVVVPLRQADDRLLAPLQNAGFTVHPVGDCVAPRDIETAIYDGHRIAREI
jgi:2,4-dienoyl-CoA reductase-like NADH-dependent reductase (Old Yellow Enzyme family)